jgi:hypothetical protein
MQHLNNLLIHLHNRRNHLLHVAQVAVAVITEEQQRAGLVVTTADTQFNNQVVAQALVLLAKADKLQDLQHQLHRCQLVVLTQQQSLDTFNEQRRFSSC